MAVQSRIAGAGRATTATRTLLSLLLLALASVALLAPPAAVTAQAAAIPGQIVRRLTGGPIQLRYTRLACPNYNSQPIWFYVTELVPGADTSTFPEPPRPFAFAADATALGGYRIMALFTANDGATYTAAEGFDPCEHTTCAGVTCANAGEQIAQNYDNYGAYFIASVFGESLSYPNWGATGEVPVERCQCVEADTMEPPPAGTASAFVVDPAGPAAEQSSAVCASLICDPTATAAVNRLYYITSATGTAAGCRCCRRQPDLIAPSAASPPVCDELTPVVNPALNDGALLGLVTGVCPAAAVPLITAATIGVVRDSVCCYFVHNAPGGGGTVVDYRCGGSLAVTLAAEAGGGDLTCLSTLRGYAFSCCGAVDSDGVVTTKGSGSACRGIGVDSGDGSGDRASGGPRATGLAPLVAVALGVMAAAAGEL